MQVITDLMAIMSDPDAYKSPDKLDQLAAELTQTATALREKAVPSTSR